MKLPIDRYLETGEPMILPLCHGPRAGEKLAIVLGMCEDPTCGCADVDFYCWPLKGEQVPADDQLTIVFALDAWNRRVIKPAAGELTHEGRSLGKAVMGEFEEEDWQNLIEYVKLVKQEAMRTADLTSCEVEFPPEVMSGDDNMVGYREIFPYGELVSFELGDCLWLVDDHYCVDPDCDCTAVALTFGNVPKESRTTNPGTSDTTPAAIYDYDDGKVEKVEVEPQAGQPAIEELMQASRSGHEAFDAEVKTRHLLLRQLFRKASQREDAAPVPARRAEPKIGRNDPCPCGSGEKYKKCCGMMTEDAEDE